MTNQAIALDEIQASFGISDDSWGRHPASPHASQWRSASERELSGPDDLTLQYARRVRVSVAPPEAHPSQLDQAIAIEGGRRKYAVRYLAVWNALMWVAIAWAMLTGYSLAEPNFWLDPWAGAFGCAALIWIAYTLFVAGQSRRAPAS